MSLQRGDQVVIYDDPIEETRPEGSAILIRRISTLGEHNGRLVGHWQVRFTDEDGGYRCVRTVLEPKRLA